MLVLSLPIFCVSSDGVSVLTLILLSAPVYTTSSIMSPVISSTQCDYDPTTKVSDYCQEGTTNVYEEP